MSSAGIQSLLPWTYKPWRPPGSNPSFVLFARWVSANTPACRGSVCELPVSSPPFPALLIHQAPATCQSCAGHGDSCARGRGGRPAGADKRTATAEMQTLAGAPPAVGHRDAPAPLRHRSQKRTPSPDRGSLGPQTRGRAAVTGRFSTAGPPRKAEDPRGVTGGQRDTALHLKAPPAPGLFCFRERTGCGQNRVRTARG